MNASGTHLCRGLLRKLRAITWITKKASSTLWALWGEGKRKKLARVLETRMTQERKKILKQGPKKKKGTGGKIKPCKRKKTTEKQGGGRGCVDKQNSPSGSEQNKKGDKEIGF